MQSLSWAARRIAPLKAFIVSADSVMSLFAFPTRILQGSARRFKQPTVVEYRQGSPARHQSDEL